MNKPKKRNKRPEAGLVSRRLVKSVIVYKKSSMTEFISRTKCSVFWSRKSINQVAMIIFIMILQDIASPVVAVGGRAQDVTLDEQEISSAHGGATITDQNDSDGGGASWGQEVEDKMKNLDAFLESLPVLSVGQKHAARIECELNKEIGSSVKVSGGVVCHKFRLIPRRLVWIKLIRSNEQSHQVARQLKSKQMVNSNPTKDDTKLISLDQKLITPDKRFRVHRQAAHKWALSIDNVQPDDGNAYYLCQASAAEQPAARANSCHSHPGARAGNLSSGSCEAAPATVTAQPEVGRSATVATSSFIGGARLNVLAPPRIVEQETSASLVLANEYDSLILRCKVLGEPQSQIMWKREDNRPLDLGAGLRFRHESLRKPNHQILSIDSSELVFEPFLRSHSGAYLCIASNGIQPGVSQRINVMSVNCRAHGNQSAPGSENCDLPLATTTPGPDSTTLVMATSEQSTRKLWRTSGGRQDSILQQPSKSVKQHRLLQPDKRRANGRNASSEPTTNGGAQVSIRPMESSGATGSQHGGLAHHLTASTSGRLISCSWFLCLGWLIILLHF